MDTFWASFTAVVLGLLAAVTLTSPDTPKWLVSSSNWWGSYDQTDDYRGGTRSGFRLYVDYGTGCQYLVPLMGGATPRLDADGRQICTPTPPRGDGE